MDPNYRFLFSAGDSGAEVDESPYNSDASDIDDETSCLLYSQIYYEDYTPPDSDKANAQDSLPYTLQPVTELFSAAQPVLPETPSTSPQPGVVESLKTDDKKPIATESPKLKKKSKKKKKVEQADDVIRISSDASVTKSSKKRKKAEMESKTDKKKLEKFLKQQIVISDDSDMESKAKAVGLKSKTPTKQRNSKTDKKMIKSLEIVAQTTKSGKKSSKGEVISKRKLNEESSVNSKKQKYDEHVTISIDSDSDDIIVLDLVTQKKLLDVSGDSDMSSVESIGRDIGSESFSGIQVHMDVPDSDISSVERIGRDSGESFSGIHFNMDVPDSDLVKSIESGKSLKAILKRLGDGDWSTDRPLARSSSMKRYYSNSSKIGRRPLCKRCNIVHLSDAECRKRDPTCYLCCAQGHMSSQCPQVLCHKCNLPEHLQADCPNTTSAQYVTCKRCKMRGHKDNMCPDIWRQYHMTTDGSDVPMTTTRCLENPNRFCSNCASTEHFVHDCNAYRHRRYDFPQYAFIAQYDVARVIKDRASNSELPKPLKYIDENMNGSDLVAQAHQSYGTPLHEKSWSQKHAGKTPNRREEGAFRGFNQKKTPNRRDDASANGFNRNRTPNRHEQSMSNGYNRSKTPNRHEQSTPKGNYGSKTPNKRDETPSSAFKQHKSSKDLSSSPQGPSGTYIRPHQAIKSFLKTAIQTTQKLNTMRNQLKREKKERKLEKKEKEILKKQLRSPQQIVFDGQSNSAAKSPSAKKKKPQRKTEKAQKSPCLVNGASSPRTPSGNTSEQKKKRKSRVPLMQEFLDLRGIDVLGKKKRKKKKKIPTYLA